MKHLFLSCSLRLEAGYYLYDHELTEHINSLEARLGWTVKFEKGDFIGRDALLKVKEQGPQRSLWAPTNVRIHLLKVIY